jgi:hypothetical protein
MTSVFYVLIAFKKNIIMICGVPLLIRHVFEVISQSTVATPDIPVATVTRPYILPFVVAVFTSVHCCYDVNQSHYTSNAMRQTKKICVSQGVEKV